MLKFRDFQWMRLSMAVLDRFWHVGYQTITQRFFFRKMNFCQHRSTHAQRIPLERCTPNAGTPCTTWHPPPTLLLLASCDSMAKSLQLMHWNAPWEMPVLRFRYTSCCLVKGSRSLWGMWGEEAWSGNGVYAAAWEPVFVITMKCQPSCRDLASMYEGFWALHWSSRRKDGWVFSYLWNFLSTCGPRSHQIVKMH